MDDSFNVKSFNVNGLSQKEKRTAIFRKLKKENSFICLQETHCTDSLINIWKKEWNGHIEFSNGSSNSKGVAILFPDNFDLEKIVYVDKDDDGRFLLVTVKLDNTEITLINLYAPTKDHKKEQICFINMVKEKILNFEETSLVIAGDLNIYLDPVLDKADDVSNKNDHPEYRNELLSVMENYDLVDVWRVMNPNVRRYTWHSRGLSSRLDYILLSEHLLNNMRKCDINPGLLSDHSILYVTFNNNSGENRGKGLWKFNNTLLYDKEYVDFMKNIIKDSLILYDSLDNKGLKWDMVKMEIRSHTISYCIKKSKERKKHISDLENRLCILREHIDMYNKKEDNEEYNCIKKELDEFELQSARGHIFRSKVKWNEEGERNTKFFMSQEKKNYLNKCITQLIDSDNRIVMDKEAILEMQRNFYKELYTENIDSNSEDFKLHSSLFLQEDTPILTKEEKAICDSDITQRELLISLKELKNGKTPGTDGLTTDFYKFFWVDIKDCLYDSILYAIHNGELSVEQKRGIISLIPKKDKDRLFLKNWRPISLLNTDYKLLAKCLAMRLKKILPNIINHDQTGYLKGRFIGENIRNIEDILFYTEKFQLPGIMVTIDFEKAFDSLNWSFLDACLEHFNFGKIFRKYINVLYSNIESATSNNGHISKFFTLERGVRQGCPLSPYLFIIAIEVLAQNIRKNDNIDGIKISNENIKISQLADDTTCFLGNLESLNILLKTFHEYSLCSGLKMNTSKSNAKYIGSLRECDYFPHGLSWIKDDFIQCLGVTFTDTAENNYIYNYKQRISNLRTMLNIWKQRNLSYKGKVTVINNLALAPLIYISSVIETPERVISEVNNIIQDFFWDGKRPKIAKNTLIQSINRGGLKLCDFGTKVKSLKISWVARLISEDNARWKVIPREFYKTEDLSVYFQYKHAAIKIKSNIQEISHFYVNVHNSWCEVHSREPEGVQEILQEFLWNNKFITIEGKPLFWRDWVAKGICKIKDLIDEHGNFLDHNRISEKFQVNCNFINTLQIRLSIPLSWRKSISDSSNLQINSFLPEPCITINRKAVQISKLKSKHFYWKLVNLKNIEPSCIRKWSEVFPNFRNVDSNIWNRIFSMSFMTIRDTRIQSFQYRVIHRTLPCNKWLCDITIKDSNQCNYCSAVDDITHFLIDCDKTFLFWTHFVNWWNRNSDLMLNTTNEVFKECILFGFPDNKMYRVINYCTLHAKYFVYIKKINGSDCIDFYEFLVYLKSKINIEKAICQKNNETFMFETIVI